MNKVIMDKMREYNQEYKILLENLSREIENDNLKYILDETYIFWNMHKNLIQLFLRNIPHHYDTYFFTGATFLDCDDYEHFPLVVLGKVHIIDDAVSKYVKIMDNDISDQFKKKLKEQVAFSIQDNLKVLELNDNNMFVLPVTYFNLLNNSQNQIDAMANEFVLNLFKEKKNNKEELFESYNNIDSFINQIKDEAKDVIIFQEYYDVNMDLKERYIRYIQENILPFAQEISDIYKFYFIVYGFFVQALQIACFCIEYSVVPYLRYDISFHYFCVIANNFKEKYGIDNIILRSACANMIYKLFEKKKIKNKNFKSYHDNIYKLEINDNFFSYISKENIDINKLDSLNKLSKYIIETLKNIY